MGESAQSLLAESARIFLVAQQRASCEGASCVSNAIAMPIVVTPWLHGIHEWPRWIRLLHTCPLYATVHIVYEASFAEKRLLRRLLARAASAEMQIGVFDGCRSQKRREAHLGNAHYSSRCFPS